MGLTSLEDTIKDQAKKRSNAHFMLVDGMSKLTSEKVLWCNSLDFHASGLKWKLYILSDAVTGFLSLYLWITDSRCVGSNWEVTCSYKLSVLSQTGGSYICKPFTSRFNAKDGAWGEPSFISRTALKEGCLVNDKAVFVAEITEVKPKFLDVTSNSITKGTAECYKLIEVPRNNSKFTWKITQFSSLNGEHHSSYEFTVGSRRWCLEMYPNGCLEGKGNSLSLFLHASNPKEATWAVYKLRVLDHDQLKRNHYEKLVDHKFSSNDQTWGFRQFLPLEELHKASNGYLVNDEIYVGVEFQYVSTQEYL